MSTTCFFSCSSCQVPNARVQSESHLWQKARKKCPGAVSLGVFKVMSMFPLFLPSFRDDFVCLPGDLSKSKFLKITTDLRPVNPGFFAGSARGGGSWPQAIASLEASGSIRSVKTRKVQCFTSMYIHGISKHVYPCLIYLCYMDMYFICHLSTYCNLFFEESHNLPMIESLPVRHTLEWCRVMYQHSMSQT